MRPPTERDDRKARPVYRGEEPDVDGTIYQEYRFANGYPGFMGSAGWFTYERRFVEWAEARGLRVRLRGVERPRARPRRRRRLRPRARRRSRRVLVGRPAGADRGSTSRSGGNYASMSGNTMFWQVRLEDATGRAMVCHKYRGPRERPRVGTDAQATMTGMWGDPMVGRPETALLGAGSALRPVQPLRRGHATRLGRVHRLPQRSLDVRRHRPALRRPARRRPTASSATRPSAAGWLSIAYQLPVRGGRRRNARHGRGRRVHAVVEPGDGRVPGVDRRARRSGRPGVRRLAPVRPRRRRDVGAVQVRQRGDADVSSVWTTTAARSSPSARPTGSSGSPATRSSAGSRAT